MKPGVEMWLGMGKVGKDEGEFWVAGIIIGRGGASGEIPRHLSYLPVYEIMNMGIKLTGIW